MRAIGEAARAAGLPTKTVRYYAEIDLVRPEARSEAGYRLYSERDIARLSFIRRARSFGFSVEACRDLLALYGDQARSSADVKSIASNHLEALDAQLQELQTLRGELEALVNACNGDERANCPIINRLAGSAEAGSA